MDVRRSLADRSFPEGRFVDVEQKGFHESRIGDIAAIEQASRVVDGIRICVEGVKPA